MFHQYNDINFVYNSHHLKRIYTDLVFMGEISPLTDAM